MTFYKQPPSARMSTPNESEQVFDKLNPNSAPWGIDHPPIDVGSLPALVRFAPDRLKSGGFVECKGVGKDGIVKVKMEQLYALQFWHMLLPVTIFIWNSFRKQHAELSLKTFMDACQEHGTIQQFPDNNKPAWFIHVDFLNVMWEAA